MSAFIYSCVYMLLDDMCIYILSYFIGCLRLGHRSRLIYHGLIAENRIILLFSIDIHTQRDIVCSVQHLLSATALLNHSL